MQFSALKALSHHSTVWHSHAIDVQIWAMKAATGQSTDLKGIDPSKLFATPMPYFCSK